MVLDENTRIENLIEKIRDLIKGSREELLEAVSLARSIVYDMRGDNHPLIGDLDQGLKMLSMSGMRSTPAEMSEGNTDATHKQLQLGIAAFLAGAALEDALRRLCDANSISYDSQRTSISKLREVLYQPSNQIEVISQSETKQITAWGDTRNKADHGRFSEITHSEVLSMVIGVRGFIDKHLP